LVADGALARGGDAAADRVDGDDDSDFLLSPPLSLKAAMATKTANTPATPNAHRLLIDPPGLAGCDAPGAGTGAPATAYPGIGAAGVGGAEIVQFVPSQ